MSSTISTKTSNFQCKGFGHLKKKSMKKIVDCVAPRPDIHFGSNKLFSDSSIKSSNGKLEKNIKNNT